MTIELPESLGVQLRDLSARWGQTPEEIIEMLLQDEFERLASVRTSDAFRMRMDALQSEYAEALAAESERLASPSLDDRETEPDHTLEQRFDDDYPLTPEDVEAISEHIEEHEE